MVQRTADDRDAALDRLRLELHSRTAEHALMINDRTDAQATLPSHEDVQVTPPLLRIPIAPSTVNTHPSPCPLLVYLGLPI